ncbi:MAG: hypothetical protein K6T37_04140 [Acidothermus cellulolyticus]|nr:hypothetical protein [Acidothermus cellulolyticus]
MSSNRLRASLSTAIAGTLLVAAAACASSAHPSGSSATGESASSTPASSPSSGPSGSPSSGNPVGPPTGDSPTSAAPTACSAPPAGTVSAAPTPDNVADVTTYLCVQAGATIYLSFPNYPGGWTPLQIQPSTAARVIATSARPDGSSSATVHVLSTTAFTMTTLSADHEALQRSWTVNVKVTSS